MTSELTIKIKQGELKGNIKKTVSGKEYCCFLGIPFAEPPVGNLRFKDPVPKKPWDGILDATKEGDYAPQYKLFTTEYIGSDDCLYLNIATPLNSTSKNKFPVMVNIHGGGYMSGSGSFDFFGPDYIVEQDTIFVGFNYRVDIIGFLCTDSINAKGDMGLKDQNLALKWVKENIEAFGGDTNNITIFGISAGSSSVEYHLLSPMSRGLFNKAILQSGSVLNPWARTRGAIKHALRLAKMIGYDSDSYDGLFEFINKIDSKTLIDASKKIMNNDDLMEGNLFGFAPVINEFKNNDGFLNEEPYELLKNGNFAKIPTITGFCEYEGMMMLYFYGIKEFKDDIEDGLYSKYIPSYLNKSIINLDNKLKALYNKENNVRNDNDYIMNFLSDLTFNGGIIHSFDMKMAHNPVNNYFYYFTYDGDSNFVKKILKIKEKGACHADEWAYLGTTKDIDNKLINTDELVKEKLVKLWTNFAKTGNPTPDASNPIEEKWLPVTENEFNYLEINSEMKVHLNTDFLPENSKLWKELHKY